jgi:hypothetical protein
MAAEKRITGAKPNERIYKDRSSFGMYVLGNF